MRHRKLSDAHTAGARFIHDAMNDDLGLPFRKAPVERTDVRRGARQEGAIVGEQLPERLEYLVAKARVKGVLLAWLQGTQERPKDRHLRATSDEDASGEYARISQARIGAIDLLRDFRPQRVTPLGVIRLR